MSARSRVAVAGAASALLVVVASALLLGGSASATPAAAPDFTREVAPIVRETCAGCHRDGGIAPFAFRTERDLANRAALVVAALASRRMPP